jgi:hypothetical protein
MYVSPSQPEHILQPPANLIPSHTVPVTVTKGVRERRVPAGRMRDHPPDLRLARRSIVENPSTWPNIPPGVKIELEGTVARKHSHE